MRDFFGNVVRVDLWTGKKLSKKQVKRNVLAENRAKGKSAEDLRRMQAVLNNEELERTGKGSDFRVRKRGPFGIGKVTSSHLEEIKSSRTAPLSKLQKKTKAKKSNYKVVRQTSLW